MTDEPEHLPPYRGYTWGGEQGVVHVVPYPGEEEADEGSKARFRAWGAWMFEDLADEHAAEQDIRQAGERTPLLPGLPNLRLIQGEGRA
ncbi:hypothetical protein [Kitasatospora brasiliensis]|uniref:hypothetical protein n=1 Tax=Kitasatospora brasiliensis TaxID=3058040 RepID=UPI0029308BE2|nr:hypothetical protein [Kitasatospora sp. K002]